MEKGVEDAKDTKVIAVLEEPAKEKRVLKLKSIDPIIFCKFSAAAVFTP
ncbi:MAG: hypothetical protein AB1609_04335 [Bacillota bacterium]